MFDSAATHTRPTPATLSAAISSELLLRVYEKNARRCVTVHGRPGCVHDQRLSVPKEERHQRLNIPKEAAVLKRLSRNGYKRRALSSPRACSFASFASSIARALRFGERALRFGERTRWRFPLPGLPGQTKPFPATPCHSRPCPVIPDLAQPCPGVPGHSRPCPTMFGHARPSWSHRRHWGARPPLDFLGAAKWP